MSDDKLLDDYKILGEYGVKMTLFHKFQYYQNIIDTCIDNNKPIPATIAKLYFTLFQNLWHVKKKRTKKITDALIKRFSKEVIRYFESDKGKGYNFSGERLVHGNTYNVLTRTVEDSTHYESYSLAQMIKSCVNSYVLLVQVLDFNKDEVIRYLYDDIEDYCAKNLTEQQKVQFPVYKRRVVAAYITMCVTENYFEGKTRVGKKDGQPVIIELSTDFRNEDLFQSTRTALDPPKLKKRKA